jgi:hypothetical protein
MTKYYTTQSLATAAAAIEQGLEGCETLYDRCKDKAEYEKKLQRPAKYISEGFFTDTNYDDDKIHICLPRQWRFPRTPHNVALMEVQHNDFIKDPKCLQSVATVEKIPTNKSIKIYWDGDEFYDDYDKENHVIIYRNNKPFPVWDKEGV